MMSRFSRCVGRVDLALKRVAERVRSVVVDRCELGISFALLVGHNLGEVGVARGVAPRSYSCTLVRLHNAVKTGSYVPTTG